MISEVFNQMRRALKTVTLDPELHSLLRERDPKALAQLEEAAADADRFADHVLACEAVLEAMLKHRAEAKRIDQMIEQLNYE